MTQKYCSLLGLLLLLCSACEKEAGPPNIVFILADDMGYGDVSYLNSKAGVKTPNIDKLGVEGMYFSDAHSPSAVCTPTRYGVLTGRYAFRSRLKRGVLVGHSKSLIDTARLTVPELLKSAGYYSGAIGKWHLGLDWSKKDSEKPLFSGNEWDIESTENVDYQGQVRGGPVDHGFDYSFINPASLDIAPYVYVSNGQVTAPVVEHIEGYNEERGVFWRHGDRAEDFVIDEVLDVFGTKAVEFIDAHANREAPFFLYLPLTAPHTPWLPGPQYKGTSEAGTYGDFVHHVDYIVGRVLNSLAANGIEENTLVIFTSDNGAHWTAEDKQKYAHRANYVFRGMKSDAWEGGHRVPFLLRWPDKVPAGGKSDATICHTDLLATVADIADIAMPPSAGEDSYSFLSQLDSTASSDRIRPFTIHHSISGVFAVRQGKWKLVDHPGSGGWSYNGANEKDQMQLYDLSKDPGERQNLVTRYPEIAAQLTEILEHVKKEAE